ncbi:MAG: ABC transporter permease [Bacillota bacterium]
MLIGSYLRSAWIWLWSNSTRTAWSILGLVVGSAAMVILLAVVRVPEAIVARQASVIGVNSITLTAAEGSTTVVDQPLADYIAENAPSLTYVIPTVTLPAAPVKAGRIVETLWVEGTSEVFPEVREWSLHSGNFFSSADLASAERVAVVGQWVVGQMFRGQNPVGQQIRIYGQVFRVIGTLESKGSILGEELDKRIVIPYSTAQRLTGQKALSAIHCHAPVPEMIPQAVSEIEHALSQRFGEDVYDGPFVVITRDEAITSLKDLTVNLRLLLSAVAAISLLSGGAGSLHLILLAVHECSSEVRLRRTLGATRLSIASQFILLAVMLGGLGGGVGSVLGFYANRQLTIWAQWPSTLSMEAILTAITVAVAIAIFSGLYPALRAARLSTTQVKRLS